MPDRITPIMGARLNKEWAEQMEALTTDEDSASATFCQDALTNYLGKRSKRQANLQQKVAQLEQSFAVLTAQLLDNGIHPNP